ncbi:MAG TPA: Ku protein [Gemmataceae bacterium]|nr:Ku protein [Gemmataceae bacterium]
MAARPSWEGHLTFNLVSIPIKAYSAVGASSGKIGFHMLHAGCNERIRYKKICPVHGEVSNDEIVSGYEVAKGQYVTVKKEERSELKEKDDKAIAVDTFVTPDAIDPIYFSGRTYYLVPNGAAAQKPYAVLMEAMRSHNRLAVARLVLSGHGQVAVVRPFERLMGMTLLTLEDQVKSPAPFEGEVGHPTVSAQERKLAADLLESATDEFDLTRYKDDYAARLAKLVESKAKRKLGRGGPTEAVGDLMEALKKSLAQQGAVGRRRTRTRTAVRAATKRRPRTKAARRVRS